MRILGWVMVLAFLGCEGQNKEGPAEVKFDRDTCHKCGMVISDRKFVTEVRGGPDKTLNKFDDVGCALKWLDEQPFSSDPSTSIWVARYTDGAWINARTAKFVPGKTSPMAYGFGAMESDPTGVDFGAMREAVRNFKRGGR